MGGWVEPNVHKIQEHRHYYNRLRKEREDRKIERERHRRKGPGTDECISDPEITSALQDGVKNPANLAKHQANPKVAPIIAKMMSKNAK